MLMIILVVVVVGEFFNLIEMAYSQSNTNNNNTNANPVTNSTINLPVLLIHGYMEDASVWNKWIDLLKYWERNNE
jgi:uncharacterized alpha/beta hydrolase family protein